MMKRTTSGEAPRLSCSSDSNSVTVVDEVMREADGYEAMNGYGWRSTTASRRRAVDTSVTSRV